MVGVVEFFDNKKGWGLIVGETDNKYFIHHEDIIDGKFFPKKNPAKFRTLKSTQKVTFQVLETNKQFNKAIMLRFKND